MENFQGIGFIWTRIYCEKLWTQNMANLPVDRMIEPPSFTYCGVDMFGPFMIKERQSEIKKYGILFTCLNSRAI